MGCSRPSSAWDSTLPSRPSSPSTPMVEPPVWSSTLEMVLPTLFQCSRVSRFHTQSRRTSSLVEPSLTIWLDSSISMESTPRVVSLHGSKSLSQLRKLPASSPSTQRLTRPRPASPLSSPRTTSSQMVRLLPSTPQDSWPQRLSSTQDLLRRVTRLLVCTIWPSPPSKIAMSISEWTSTETSSSPVVPPSTQVSKIDTTPSGPVDLPFHPSQPSRASGSPRRNTRRTVPRSSTENAYEHLSRKKSVPLLHDLGCLSH